MYPVIAPRAALDKYCLELAKEGTRICVMRLAPYVYGHNGSGFVPLAILLANKFKYAAYVGITRDLFFPSFFCFLLLFFFLLFVNCFLLQEMEQPNSRRCMWMMQPKHTYKPSQEARVDKRKSSLLFSILPFFVISLIPFAPSSLSSQLSTLYRYHVVSEINTSFKELAEAVGKLV